MIPAYELTGVQHFYGSRCVVEVPDLQIRPGEILGIVGPSGAGKSTLLRLLNFLEAPTRGRLAYNGADIGPEAPLALRREVVTVFQQPVLLRRSVMANIRTGQKIRGTADPNGEAEAWLQRLGLTGLARATARTLSAGEAQRVALARALVVRPAVILLDEPTGNLDPYNVKLIEEIVRADNAERHTTVILVTHDPFQAKRLAHRTGLMIGGKIVELAETADFFASPRHPDTAAFLNGELVGAGALPEAAPGRRRPRRRRLAAGG